MKLTIFPANSEGRKHRVPLEDFGLFFLVDFKVEHGCSVLLDEDNFGLGQGDSENRLELAIRPGGSKHLIIGVEAVGVVKSHSNLKIIRGGLREAINKKIKKYQTASQMSGSECVKVVVRVRPMNSK